LLTLFFVFFLVILGFKYRSALLLVIRSNREIWLERVSGVPTEVQGLDEAQLQRATGQMEALGFAALGDHLSRVHYSKREDTPQVFAPIADPTAAPRSHLERDRPASFTRVMTHPAHGCLAMITFISPIDSRGKVAKEALYFVTLMSFNGTADGDWSYATTNRDFKANLRAMMNLLRQPRQLSTLIPGALPDELLRTHLARRDDVAKAAGVAWKSEVTLEDEYAIEENLYSHTRALFRGVKPLELGLKFNAQLFSPKSGEWMGELQGRVPDAR
jgi:hypothetical protein